MADPLAQSLRLPCGAVLSNRIAKAAMTEGLGDARGYPTQAHVNLYGAWSKGGAGLLLTGNVVIDLQHLERPGNVVISREPDAEMRRLLATWATAGTSGGNHLWMQVSHSGRQTQTLINPHPKAPSAVPLGLPGKQFGTPTPLTEAEIVDLIARFALSVRAARETGFTGAQIHAAHGYLVSQFLSPRANKRDDKWGGPLENRARFLLDIIRASRAAVGPSFPISVKLNSADFQKGGFAFEESLKVARWLEAAGVDLIEVSGGSYEQPRMMNTEGIDTEEPKGMAPSTAAREAYFVDFAKAMRAEVKIPIMVTGGLRTRAAMLHAVETGAADVVGIARPMCVDTDAPSRIFKGEASLVRWEQSLKLLPSWLSFLKNNLIVRALEGFGVLYWFYAQLYRLGRAQPPDRTLGVFSAFREVDAYHRRLAAQTKALAGR